MVDNIIQMGPDGIVDPDGEFRIFVRGIVKDRFPTGLDFTDIVVEPCIDQDGEIYIHTYIVFDGDIKMLDPGKTLGISTLLWPKARDMGFGAVPVQSFVEKSEWAAVSR